MDVSLQQGAKFFKLSILNFVSILVLMDVSLQLENPRLADFIDHSFNPCFNGCLSSTIFDALALARILTFQSLF